MPDPSFSQREIPLVLLHGFCESNGIFSALLPKLVADQPVLAPQLPGHAGTPLQPAFEDLGQLADWLHDWVRARGFERFGLLGHSLGGYLAAAYAARYPSDLMGLMLVHSTTFADSDLRKSQRRRAMETVRQRGPGLFRRQFLDTLFPEGKPEWRAELQQMVEQVGVDALVRYSEAMANRPETTGVVASLACPVSCFAGEKDGFIPLERIREEQNRLPEAYWTVLPQVGHMAMYEAPPSLADAVQQWIGKMKDYAGRSSW